MGSRGWESNLTSHQTLLPPYYTVNCIIIYISASSNPIQPKTWKCFNRIIKIYRHFIKNSAKTFNAIIILLSSLSGLCILFCVLLKLIHVKFNVYKLYNITKKYYLKNEKTLNKVSRRGIVGWGI